MGRRSVYRPRRSVPGRHGRPRRRPAPIRRGDEGGRPPHASTTSGGDAADRATGRRERPRGPRDDEPAGERDRHLPSIRLRARRRQRQPRHRCDPRHAPAGCRRFRVIRTARSRRRARHDPAAVRGSRVPTGRRHHPAERAVVATTVRQRARPQQGLVRRRPPRRSRTHRRLRPLFDGLVRRPARRGAHGSGRGARSLRCRRRGRTGPVAVPARRRSGHPVARQRPTDRRSRATGRSRPPGRAGPRDRGRAVGSTRGRRCRARRRARIAT